MTGRGEGVASIHSSVQVAAKDNQSFTGAIIIAPAGGKREGGGQGLEQEKSHILSLQGGRRPTGDRPTAFRLSGPKGKRMTQPMTKKKNRLL